MVTEHIKTKLAQHRNTICIHTHECDRGTTYSAGHWYARREDNKIFLIESSVWHDEQHVDWIWDQHGCSGKHSKPYPKSTKRSRIIGYYSIDTDHFHFWTPCCMNRSRKYRDTDPAIKKLLPDDTWYNILSNRKPTPIPFMYKEFIKFARDMALTEAIESYL